MRRIRICEFTPTLSGGGAEERIARVLASLDPSEFESSWIGFGGVEHGLTLRAGKNVQVVSIARDARRGVEVGPVARAASAISRLRPDIVHVHNWSTSLYGIAAARIARVPVVIYGDGGRDAPDPPSRRRLAAMRALAPHVDAFTAVCDFIGREIESDWGVSGERIRVIRNGVDLDVIDSALSKREAREKLGLPQDVPIVGMIAGRFRYVKRPLLLIDAVGRVAKKHPSAHLVMVGDPLGRTRELKARAREAGLARRFHLTGHMVGVSSILRAFDVLVNCSIFEGASNSVIESMAMGLPVVATAVGGTPELIANGESGLLVPPEDTDALAEAISRFLSEPELAAACGRNARKHVERTHTHAQMLTAYTDLYRKLAGGHDEPQPDDVVHRLLSLGHSVFRAAIVPAVRRPNAEPS